MKMFYKSKHKIVLMIVLTLLFQIVGPVVGDYVYAEAEEAFSFQVVQQKDGSGKFEWKYNPNKANGQREFEIDLELELRDKFQGRLNDKDTGIEIGEFEILTNGILRATIYETDSEEPEEPENPEEVEEKQEPEEPKVSEKMVEIQENKVVIKLEVEENLEGQAAKVEILNEDQEVVEGLEVLVEENWVIAEFENLEPGNYLVRVTVGEEFEAEEEFEVEGVVVEEDEVDNEDEAKQEEEEVPVEADETETEDVEEASIFGEAIASLAYGLDSLEGMLLADAEALEEESSGGGIIPFGIMIMPIDLGEGKDLGEVEGFKYTADFYIGPSADEEGNPNDELKGGSTIKLSELKDSYLTYRISLEIPNGYGLSSKDYLNLSIEELTSIEGLKIDELGLSGEIEFIVDKAGIKAASYKVENNELKIEFNDKVIGLKDKLGRKGFVELYFNVESISKEVDIIEEITIGEKENKTFYILRDFDGFENMTKVGDYKENEDWIEWVIDVNLDMQDLQGVNLVDKIPVGLEVVNVYIADLEVKVTSDGIKKGEVEYEEPESTIPTMDGDRNITIGLGSLNRVAKSIKIVTKFAGDQDAGKVVKYYNEAKLILGDEEIAKAGHNYDFHRNKPLEKKVKSVNGNKITWEVKFKGNGKTAPLDLIDTPIFYLGDDITDKIGLVLIEDSVKLNNIKNKDITVSLGKEGEFKFSNIPNTTDFQNLEYITEVIFKDNTESSTYKVKNEVEYNGNKADSEASISRGTIINKKSGTVKGEGNDTYVYWDIVINEKNESWKDVEIHEYIPEGFEFISATTNNSMVVEVDKDGDKPKEYVGDEGKRYIKLSVKKSESDNSLDKQTTITIKTKLLDYTKIIAAQNKAKIKWVPNLSGGPGIGVGGPPGPYELDKVEGITMSEFTHTLAKSEGSIKYGHPESIASWTIEYTTKDKRVENLVIKDELTNHEVGDHKYKEDTFKLNLNGQTFNFMAGDGSTETIAISGDYRLTYKFKVDNGATTGNRNFNLIIVKAVKTSDDGISLINPYHNNVALSYDTEFDLTKTDDQETSIFLNNIATATNGDSPPPSNSKAEIVYPISRNGTKSGKLFDGRNMKWIVELNHKGRTIPAENVITDTLNPVGKQKYKEDTIKVYTTSIKEDGTLDYDSRKLLTKGDDKDYELNITHVPVPGTVLDKYDSGMTIEFKNNVTTPLIIEYETVAVGESVEKYFNEINYNKVDYKGEVGYENYDKVITKELLNGRPATGTADKVVVRGDVLVWQLKVNTSLSQIHDFVLTDEMGDGLLYIPDSLIIKESKDEDGEKPSIEENGFSLKELLDSEGKKLNGIQLENEYIDKEYFIEYQTLVIADKDAKDISNKVSINGKELINSSQKVETFAIYSRSAAGGSGYSATGFEYPEQKIIIEKVDTDKRLIKLSKAKFNLITEISFDPENPIIIEDEIETKNGEIVLNLIKNDNYKYYLEEIVAPDGYVLNSGRIEIDLEELEKNNNTLQVINTKPDEATGSITFTKVGEDDDALKGAVFTLTAEDGTEKIATSDKDGKVTFSNVKSGKYTIEETEAPEGYVSDSNPIEVEIKITVNGQTFTLEELDSQWIDNKIPNKRKTYAIGDYVWIDDESNLDTDKDGIQNEVNPLEGVKVQLYEVGDEGNPILKEETTSNNNGRYFFDKLPAGKYKIKFILTEDQAKKYEFTTANQGDNSKKEELDSNADQYTGWTDIIELGDGDHILPSTTYNGDPDLGGKQSGKVEATVGIDPRWDAGVVLREILTIKGSKTWEDNKNATGMRPEKITINLLQDGNEIHSQDITEANEWKWEFKEGDLYVRKPASDEEYRYTIVEEQIDNYTAMIDDYNVINKYTPGQASVQVIKVWIDGSGKTPVNIVVKLLANGEETNKTLTLSKSNNWTDTFKELDKYKDGKEIDYTVEEVEVQEYLTEIKGNAKEGFVIKNIRKTYAIGDYTWIDRNKNGIQDDEEVLVGVKVELYDKDKNLLDTTYTDGNGKYIFDELLAGEYYVKFTLTPQQARRYRFTGQNNGDNGKDSDANPNTGWTEEIALNGDNEYLTKEYDDQEFKATEGIDPTWDAGVVLRPIDPVEPDPSPGPNPGPDGGGGGPRDPEDPKNPPKEDPKDPEKPTDPTDPTDPNNPVDPTDPVDPTNPTDPATPEKPVDPEIPTDPEDPTIQETPEPTIPIVLDPPAHGTITFDEDGNWIYTPEPGATGKVTFTIVHPDGREETITINLDDIPQGTKEVTAETLVKLPKTGAVSNLGFYLAGLSLIFLGIFLRKRIA